jgi:hypothetical protein
VVDATFKNPRVSAEVIRLAERLDIRGRLCWDEVADLLGEQLQCGSLSVDALPSAPPEAMNE